MSNNQIIFFLYEGNALKEKKYFFLTTEMPTNTFSKKTTSFNFQRDLKSLSLLFLVVD